MSVFVNLILFGAFLYLFLKKKDVTDYYVKAERPSRNYVLQTRSDGDLVVHYIIDQKGEKEYKVLNVKRKWYGMEFFTTGNRVFCFDYSLGSAQEGLVENNKIRWLKREIKEAKEELSASPFEKAERKYRRSTRKSKKKKTEKYFH